MEDNIKTIRAVIDAKMPDKMKKQLSQFIKKLKQQALKLREIKL